MDPKLAILRPTDQAFRFAKHRYERRRAEQIKNGLAREDELLTWDQLHETHDRCATDECRCQEMEVHDARKDLRWFLWDQLNRIGGMDDEPPQPKVGEDVWTGNDS